LPLWGKRIVITAPRQYAAKLGAALLEAGAQPIWLPTIATVALKDAKHLRQLDAALSNLGVFRHIAFTSRSGIEAVVARLADTRHGGDRRAAAVELGSCGATLWALGADGGALTDLGIKDVQTPNEASTQGLVRELVARGEADGAAVLCPVPHVETPLKEPVVVPRFLEALEAAGVTATRVPAYLTEAATVDAAHFLDAAFPRDGAGVDAIAFSSTAEAQGLQHLLTAYNRRRAWAAMEKVGVPLAAHGPYTAAGVEATLGKPVAIVSENFSSFRGVVAALELYFSSSPAAH